LFDRGKEGIHIHQNDGAFPGSEGCVSHGHCVCEDACR
jgi:hypothetical protein